MVVALRRKVHAHALKAGGNIGASDSIADIFADETQIEMASSVATCPRYSLHVRGHCSQEDRATSLAMNQPMMIPSRNAASIPPPQMS